MLEGFFNRKKAEVPEKGKVLPIVQGERTVTDQYGNAISSATSQEDAIKKFRQNAIEQRDAA